MNKQNFLKALSDLNLTQTEAAKFLSVDVRTIRRWVENSGEIPGAIEHVLTAWLRLDKIGLSWRPDGLDIVETDPYKLAEEIVRFRRHALEMDNLLNKVKERGGPVVPWQVNLKEKIAILGPMRVGFYRLVNGSFSPSFYSRSDEYGPDLQRDRSLLEDAYACIAKAIAKEVVQ